MTRLPLAPIVMAMQLAALPATAGALPSGDELIEKSVEAMGGTAIQKIESYMASSELTTPSGTVATDVFWGKPGRIFIQTDVPNRGKMEMGTNGTIGWMVQPMRDHQLLQGPQLLMIRQQATHSRVLNLRQTMTDDNQQLGDVTEADFDGVACYKLRVTAQTANRRETGALYFDKDTGLLRGMRVGGVDALQTSTVTFKDWKKIDGVNFFHHMDVTAGDVTMTVNYTKIELNTVKPDVFRIPAEIKTQVRTAPPDVQTKSINDYSLQVQEMINRTLEGLPMDDSDALRQARARLAEQVEQMRGEDRSGMKYVLWKIDLRLNQLGGS